MTLKKLLLFVTLPLYVLDQWTKWWVVGRFPEPARGAFSSDGHIPVIEGYFNLVRVHNQGVAFGLGNGSTWAPVVFMIVPFIAMIMLRVFWKLGVFSNRTSRVAVALLITGIFGNFTDRLLQGSHLSYMADAPFWERLRAGYVVDFLDVTIPVVNYRWPSFNVADSCVCVAATLLFIGGILDEKAKKKAAVT
ncbi:MAG: signal peptidase II [Verrucomicrobiales bacterium]